MLYVCIDLSLASFSKHNIQALKSTGRAHEPDPSNVAMEMTTIMLHGVSSTSVAVGVEQGCGVREACAVGIVVDSPHSGFISSAVLPWDVDRIADAAVSQPARITLV